MRRDVILQVQVTVQADPDENVLLIAMDSVAHALKGKVNREREDSGLVWAQVNTAEKV